MRADCDKEGHTSWQCLPPQATVWNREVLRSPPPPAAGLYPAGRSAEMAPRSAVQAEWIPPLACGCTLPAERGAELGVESPSFARGRVLIHIVGEVTQFVSGGS